MITASPLSRLRSTTRRSALVAAAVAATASLGAAPAANAAGPAPLFQMPVQCGQMWEATTYANHGPDPDSIDLGMWSDDNDNLSDGQPALASADGVVTKVGINGKDENEVFLDHGNGWTTQHKHLQTIPPVVVGQAVAQGQQIGRIGRSGADEFHLHYTQLRDGTAVKIQFNGTEIETGQDNPDTWGDWVTRDGEQLTSNNCPGRAFVPFFQDAKQHFLAYENARGAAGIASIKSDASGVTNPWGTTSGDKMWTHFMPFSVAGDTRYISYASATGAVQFDRIRTTGPTKLSAGTWGKGWTHLMPFTLGTSPYFIAYNALTGSANVDRINAAGTGSTTAIGTTWTKGWTQLVPFRMSGVQYFLTYRGGTGEVKVNKVTGSGDNVVIDNVWQGTWSTGWTHLVPMVHDGIVQLLRYKQATGLASFDKINAGGLGVANLGTEGWTTRWSTFSPFTLNGDGHVLAYKVTGSAKILRLNAGGGSTSTTSSMGWTLGLA